MARVKTGVAVADIRGALGGSVFQKSAQGLSVRNNTAPVNVQSPLQMANRARSFSLQQHWQNISNDERTAWQAWAEFQNLETGFFSTALMTGQQAFYQCNWYRLAVGLAVLAEPVFTGFSREVTFNNITVDGLQMFINLSTANLPASFRPIFRLSNQLRASQAKAPGGLRSCQASGYASLEYRIDVPYVGHFGRIPTDTSSVELEWGITQVDNGTLSVFERTVTTVYHI